MKDGLHELFVNELQDMYHAESQLVKTLPKLAKSAQDEELREAFQEHLKETENHVSRLEKVFQSLDEPAKRRRCKGMAGVIDEGKEMLSDNKGHDSLDAALIAAAQKAEHYEIASYGSLCTWAEMMGHSEALNLLKQNLSEEKAADEKLTEIALASANPRAQHAD
jgi:ferritin-like metal-binding protein YciE